jgi:hypothetical protein
MADIHKDDPLGMLKGGAGKEKKGLLLLEDGAEDKGGEDEHGMHASASALIDAIHAKDPVAVADAFKAMSMHAPGEDDEDMPPSSENAPMLGGEVR